jgi:hypothetical protein
MIVWINGAFGAGKTQTAHELCRRLARGWVCDPELLGFAIQRMQPPPRRADFQDEPLWRTGVRDLIGQLDDAPELSPVIVARRADQAHPLTSRPPPRNRTGEWPLGHPPGVTLG